MMTVDPRQFEPLFARMLYDPTWLWLRTPQAVARWLASCARRNPWRA